MERQILLLSALIPWLGAFACLSDRFARRAVAASVVSSAGIWLAALLTSAAVAEPQIATAWNWLPQAQLMLVFGIDGLNLPILLLVATVFPALFLFQDEKVRAGFWANALLLAAQGSALAACLSLDVLSYVAASTALGLAALAFGASFCVDRTGSSWRRQGFRVAGGSLLVLMSGLALYQTTQPRTLSFWEMSPELAPALAMTVLAALLLGTVIRSPLRVLEDSGPAVAYTLLAALSAVIAWHGAVRLSLSALQGAVAAASPALIAGGCSVALGAAIAALAAGRRRHGVARSLRWALLSHAGVLLVALALLERTALTGGLLLAWAFPLGWAALYALRPWPSPAFFVIPMLAGFPGAALLAYGAYLDGAGYAALVAVASALMLTGLMGRDLLKNKEKPAASGWGARGALWLAFLALALTGIAPRLLIDHIRPTVALLLMEDR